MQRGYIILIAGAVLLISGIVISILWAVPFAGTIIRENTILSGVSIRPAGSVIASTQVTDTSRPVSLAIHLEHNNSTSEAQIPSNILRETVRNPNGVIMTSNEFIKQFFTTFKPDITGKYTVTIYNLGNSPVSIGVLAGNLPFIGPNNQVNFNSLSGIIAGIILTIAGIIVLIAGVIVLILDRRRITPRIDTTLTSSSATTNTETETIVLARWIDRFIAFPHWFETTNMNMGFRGLSGPWLPYPISSLVFIAYWTYFESTTGQSIGKKLLHLKTTDLDGKTIDVKTAVIESFGKAFLLPLDVILGWIFTNNKRQRIFNRASNTIVIKLKENNTISNNVTYLKD
jgi:uncharacterized RDD family membrane protein YckC/UPF0716 family protein affecting phage T7 exclusion